MKILELGMQSYQDEKECPRFITTYEEFQKYKHTNACIYRDLYEKFMDLDSDDLFVRPIGQEIPKKEPKAFDPYEDLNEKNKLLAELKAKNLVYKKDPTYVPVQITETIDPKILVVKPEDIVKAAFNKDGWRR